MRKRLIIAVSIMSFLGVVPAAFAHGSKQGKSILKPSMESTRGTVISIDQTQKQMTVKEEGSGQEKTFAISSAQASEVKVGETVKIKNKPGSAVAQSVKVIKAGVTQKTKK